MDMDQRTRFIGGRAGRIILLGNGTEILAGQSHDDDGDIDMEDRGEAEEAEDKDLEEQVTKGQEDAKAPNGEADEADRSTREETPAPASQGKDTEPAEKVEEAKKEQVASGQDEPKMMAATDSADAKSVAEHVEK